MISETSFAAHYPSLWRSLTPALEDFVRRTNMDGYERQWTPMTTSSLPERRGIVNEAGFLLYRSIALSKSNEINPLLKENSATAFADATSYVLSTPPVYDDDIAHYEIVESSIIAERLFYFFEPMRNLFGIEIQPQFKGNGVICSCSGDVLIGGSRLFEIKNGDRPFRSVDYRQLCVYMALDFAHKNKVLDSIAIVNVRRGTYSEISSDDFSKLVSGQSASSLCHMIIEAMSANLVSE